MKLPVLLFLLSCTGISLTQAAPWVTYEPKPGPGQSRHIVFLSGDEEYRSEEGLPQLAKILAQRHGFKCTVLFAINKENGQIDPTTVDNIPGLEALESADLMVMFMRWLELPDEHACSKKWSRS